MWTTKRELLLSTMLYYFADLYYLLLFQMLYGQQKEPVRTTTLTPALQICWEAISLLSSTSRYIIGCVASVRWPRDLAVQQRSTSVSIFWWLIKEYGACCHPQDGCWRAVQGVCFTGYSATMTPRCGITSTILELKLRLREEGEEGRERQTTARESYQLVSVSISSRQIQLTRTRLLQTNSLTLKIKEFQNPAWPTQLPNGSNQAQRYWNIHRDCKGSTLSFI